MGDEMKATRELEGIKEQMSLLAEEMEKLDVDLDSQVVADILTELSEGKRAEYIIERYGITEESGV